MLTKAKLLLAACMVGLVAAVGGVAAQSGCTGQESPTGCLTRQLDQISTQFAQLKTIEASLRAENKGLEKRVEKLEAALVAATNEIAASKTRLDQLKITLGDENIKNVTEGEFWNSNAVNNVYHTCPDKFVMVGMEFELAGRNGVRTPTRIKFHCRSLRP